MKKLKTLIILLGLSFNVIAQVAPIGKKTLKVKESYEGEYMQKMIDHPSGALENHMRKSIPKKLKKYGFNDITIIELGMVRVPVSTATKMSKAVGGNKGAGKAQLKLAKTHSEIERAVDKMYEKDVDNDWKFQVNFIDNNTKEEYRVRLSMMSKAPKYIIKRSDKIVNLRE